MDVYVKQILGSSNHDLFYTDSSVKTAFKKYVSGFVGRYKNEPTVMAWFASQPPTPGSADNVY
jgi:mannan endo-1,4-beta-mannosidase